jgi:hypothetical protein
MKVNFPAEGPDDIVRRVKTDITSWAPRSGPDWADLQARVSERPLLVLRTYAIAAAALVLIIVAAFAVMSAYDLGGLGNQPVVTHAASGR